MREEDIKINVKTNNKELEEMADTLERIGDAMPNIVIRDNQNVYLTINNWSEKETIEPIKAEFDENFIKEQKED